MHFISPLFAPRGVPSRGPGNRLLKSILWSGLLGLGSILLAGPAGAANRVVTISAPPSVVAGTKVEVPVFAATDAGEGEQIGFFHGEYSVDDGRTWIGFCYEDHLGASATRHARFTAGNAGSKVIVRVRIAFREGPAGDVDFNGAALKWQDSWKGWEAPPAKYATITVVAP